MLIFDVATVEAAIAKQALKGSVIVFLTTPMHGVTQLTIPVANFKRLRNVNAIHLYDRVVVSNNQGIYDVVVLEDGFLKLSGWVHESHLVVEFDSVGAVTELPSFGTLATDKNPEPTHTYFRQTIVGYAGKLYYVLFETRGVAINDQTVNEFMPQGMFFTEQGYLDNYLQARLSALSDPTVKPPKAESLSYFGLKTA